MAALAAALVLCCAGPASAAPVASRSAVLGAGDVAGLTVGSAPASAWLNLVGSHAGSGGHASTTVVKSGGSPTLLIVSHALVARDGVHASAAKRALGAVSPARANGVDARALGVSAAALRKAQRIAWRDGPVVGQLVVVGAGKDDALVRRLQDVVRTRVRRTLDQSAWDALLARVAARGGRADASTAVQAFSLAVAPLPGVRVPKGPKGSIPEGTLAISWVLANYGRLTPGVRQAFDKAVRRAFGLSREVPAAGGQLNAVKDQAVAFVGDRAGVQVTIPISVVRGYPSTARGAAAMGVDAGGSYRSDKPAARCIISVRSAGVSKTVIAHEVFHCVQIQLTGRANGLGALDADRAWLGEGSASYAGCLFSQDGAAPYRKAYAAYVEQPLTPLGSRSYDAVGYFAHLDASGAGALSGVRQAIASSSLAAAAFPASGEGAPDILDAWASSLYRSPSLGAQWDVSGACVPPRSAAAQATPIVLTAGESVTLVAPAYAAHPYTLFASHSTSDAIRVHVASGRVRIGAAGVDARPTGDAVYCLGNAASGANPQVALTGGLTGAKVTMTAVDASVACGPGGSATCAAQLCLPFSGPSSTPQPPGPLSPVPQGNPIPAENAKPGTPISVWDIAP
ncbi:MAG TPA: hypothetical protein VLK59_02865, partial [Solirubrobacteraceae bacterium]|nr:hypothetical protein [Solirubrobacteraceae bacterium]